MLRISGMLSPGPSLGLNFLDAVMFGTFGVALSLPFLLPGESVNRAISKLLFCLYALCALHIGKVLR